MDNRCLITTQKNSRWTSLKKRVTGLIGFVVYPFVAIKFHVARAIAKAKIKRKTQGHNPVTQMLGAAVGQAINAFDGPGHLAYRKLNRIDRTVIESVTPFMPE